MQHNTHKLHRYLIFSCFTWQILNFVYTEIAIKLNDQENHRTETQYEDGLISKIFSIQIVNSYSSVAWAAFFDRISSYYACPQSKYPDTCFQKVILGITRKRGLKLFCDKNIFILLYFYFVNHTTCYYSFAVVQTALMLATIFITRLFLYNISAVAIPLVCVHLLRW